MHSNQLESLELNHSTPHKKTHFMTKDHMTQPLSEVHSESTPNAKENTSLPIMSVHPAAKYIGSHNLKREEYKKFVHLLYYGLTYCVKNLKGPTEEYLRKKSVTLPEC